MQELPSLFETLKYTSNAGIYCLVNNSRDVYISYSSNISKSLVRLLDSQLFFPKFEFYILELVTEPINLRVRCQYYKDCYSSNGYNLLNPKRVSNWKVLIDLVKLPNKTSSEDTAIAVKLVSRGYRELIVALYYDHEDLHKFVNSYYPANLVTRIVYATNDLTLEYLNEKK